MILITLKINHYSMSTGIQRELIMTLISVVVPTYNRSKVIDKTFESLMKQSFKDFEVIIVDDCSHDSDELMSCIEKYKKSLSIVYIRHGTNKHGSAARNTGINIAKGKYIGFLDSDDLWDPFKIEKCFETIKNKKKNTILYSKVKDRGRIFPARPIKKGEQVDEYLICNNGTMQTSSLFMNTSFAKRILFDESLKRFQDYDFIIRAQKIYNANFIFIDQLLVEMTNSDFNGRISNSVDVYPAEFWINKISPFLTPKSKAVFSFNRISNYYIDSGNKVAAIKVFFEAKSYLYIRNLKLKVFIKLLLPSVIKSFIRR